MTKFLFILRILIAFFIAAFLFYYVIVYTPNSNLPTHLLVAGGTGTEKDPFRISNEQQLISFRIAVNSGNKFEECYFLQTSDIDLDGDGYWIPIGEYNSDLTFLGTYNGGGHCIKNILCYESAANSGNIGFFGQLGGTVMNLGIENGVFDGTSVGGIANSSAGEALIINCYNNADIIASNTGGGIVDNFSGGCISNSWFGGSILAEISGGICAQSAAMLYSCYSLEPINNSNFTGYSTLSDTMSTDDLNAGKTVELLNTHIPLCADFFRVDKDKLIGWAVNNGRLGFASTN